MNYQIRSGTNLIYDTSMPWPIGGCETNQLRTIELNLPYFSGRHNQFSIGATDHERRDSQDENDEIHVDHSREEKLLGYFLWISVEAISTDTTRTLWSTIIFIGIICFRIDTIQPHTWWYSRHRFRTTVWTHYVFSSHISRPQLDSYKTYTNKGDCNPEW